MRRELFISVSNYKHSLQFKMLIILAFFLAALAASTRHNNRVVWVFDPIPANTELSYLYPKQSNSFFAQSTSWSVRKVNPQNIDFWLQRSHSTLVKSLIETLQKGDNFVLYKDLMKCLILQHYGGLWIDDDIVLTGNLTWLQKFKTLKNTKWKNTNTPQLIAFWKNNEDISLNFVWASQHAEFFSEIISKLEDADLLDDIHQLNSYLGRLLKKKLGDGKQLIENNKVWVILQDESLPFRKFDPTQDTKAKLSEIKSNGKSLKRWDLPKIAWVYWDGGLSTSSISIRQCRENLRFFVKLRGWELRELDSFNIKEELWNIPNSARLLKLLSKQKQFTKQKNDLIKLALLNHYGGVWLDSDIVLVQDFLWVQRAFNQYAIQFKTDYPPEVLVPYSKYENISINMEKRQIPRMETYFLAASPKSQFLQDVLQEYLTIIELEKKELENRLTTNKIEIDSFTLNFIKEYEINIAMSTVLQKKRRLLSGSSNNVLNSYKIWIFSDTEGPEKLKAQNPLIMIKLFTNDTIDELQFTNQNPKYFIKFTSAESNYLSDRIMKTKSCSFNNLVEKCDHSIHSLYQTCLEDIKVFTEVDMINQKQSTAATKTKTEQKYMANSEEEEDSVSWLGITIVGIVIIVLLKKMVFDSLFSSDQSQPRSYGDIALSSKNFSSI